MSRSFIVVFLSLFLLSACVKQAPVEPRGADLGDPSAITSIDAAQPLAAADVQSASDRSESSTAEDAGGERASPVAYAERGSTQTDGEFRTDSSDDAALENGELRNLNLELPQSDENVDHLFAGSDRGPNYFKSSQGKQEKNSVRLKGKLYMIDEPTAEKRIQNVDGGEVGIVVPLR